MATTAQKPAAASAGVDPQAVMRIKGLALRTRAVVDGFLRGMHRSVRHGFSVEFSEYRPYSPGDDLRYLDWRMYARSDRHYVRRYQDETNLRCLLAVDQSRSMQFGSRGYSKSDYANTLAATLAYLFFQQRDAVGMVTFAGRVQEYLPPRFRPGQWRRILNLLEHTPSDPMTNLEDPLERIARLLHRRSLVVLISDLLVPTFDWQRQLAQLRARRHQLFVLRILDRAETQFTFQQPVLFADLEGGRTMYIDPHQARREYLRRFEEHREQLREACLATGAVHQEIVTDTPMDLAVYDFVRSLTETTGAVGGGL